MLKRTAKKSIKVSAQTWKAVKVFTAEHDWTIEGFTEQALREKMMRDMGSVQLEGDKK